MDTSSRDVLAEFAVPADQRAQSMGTGWVTGIVRVMPVNLKGRWRLQGRLLGTTGAWWRRPVLCRRRFQRLDRRDVAATTPLAILTSQRPPQGVKEGCCEVRISTVAAGKASYLPSGVSRRRSRLTKLATIIRRGGLIRRKWTRDGRVALLVLPIKREHQKWSVRLPSETLQNRPLVR